MRIYLILYLSMTNLLWASLCGEDNRTPSYDPRVAQLVTSPKSKSGCTASLIGNKCLLTAGHCRGHFKLARFDGELSSPESLYELDAKTMTGDNRLYSHDWAVYQVKRNILTGLYPGEERASYELDFSLPKEGEKVTITGHGYAQIDGAPSYIQQKSNGKILKVDGKNTILFHNVDATHGNSGSALVKLSNDKIIGVHFKGGCRSNNKGSNRATSIYYNVKLKRALLKCLNSK